jgi:GTPase Era involved in 16S rRNA processing
MEANMAIARLRPMGLGSHLDDLINTLEHYGDKANAQILNNLRIKFERHEITVACCGYVSGGKSRLLNMLIGEDNLLPVSPLPSSKNTVYIRPGKQLSLGLYHKDKPYTNIPLPATEELHDLCQDEKLDSLELLGATQEGVSFIDTPGIDSLESGNQLAGNPALLAADLVIYVTDYNHVQSQVNFSFLKNLQARKIPYLLVVNQIDKHVGLELSLPDFRNKLTEALTHWDLKPLDLCFISLLSDRHPDCQLEQLKETLSELQSAGEDLLVSTLIRSIKQVLDRHGEFFSSEQDSEREPHLWVKEQSVSEPEALLAFQQLETEVKALTALAETIESETMTEINKLLDNAPLFSFETRELARHLLESRKPGFKAGLFASTAKTQSEQAQRLQRLYSELKTRSEANLTWHLRKILANIPTSYNLPKEEYCDQIALMTVNFEPELLLQTISPGALVSGEYVMNYTRDLAAAIKYVYRQSALTWIKRAKEAAELESNRELVSLQQRLVHYRQLLYSFASLKELDTLKSIHMTELLTPWEQTAGQFSAMTFLNKHKRAYQKTVEPKAVPAVPAAHSIFPRSYQSNFGQLVRKVHPKLWGTAQDLIGCAKLINSLPGFGVRAKSLYQRAERLENNLFTVALFGAFSAGKSSLANAMIGDTVLPVSPNPTTAAINKILPPTEQCPHGTIKVKLKTLPDLTTDVLASLAVFGLTAPDLAQALRSVPDIDSPDVPIEAKPHQSFLRAVAKGQESLLQRLGEELTVEFADFRDFVVQEDMACFVESIELYFSCPLTQMGVVLVDTPGSNSTNARHTNVAFDYIKNADAVLFVTYYNNPFCKADAQFLSQLGKVKDTFEMDKMFFLVNAADLAQTDEELSLVLKHVEQNLHSCDIIRPRIFPVSSQMALLAKLASSGNLQPEAEHLYRQRLKLSKAATLPAPDQSLVHSGLKTFETSFYSFIEEDLINLAVESAEKEISRILQHVDGLLEVAKTDDSQRVEKLQFYRTLEQKILSGINQISLLAEESSISQEIDELIYYVNQRLFHRFSDLFKRCFLVLAKPKEEQAKTVYHCFNEFLQEIEVDLAQEIRATSLRAERFVQKSLTIVFNKQRTLLGQYDPLCSLQDVQQFAFPEEPKAAVLSWDSSALSKIPSLYKNPKDWVEGQGRTKMLEAVVKVLQPQIQTWLNDRKGYFKEFWNDLFVLETNKLKEQTRTEVIDYYSRLASALGNGYNLAHLGEVRTELAKLVDK